MHWILSRKYIGEKRWAVFYLYQHRRECYYIIDGLGYNKGKHLEVEGWEWIAGPEGGMWIKK